ILGLLPPSQAQRRAAELTSAALDLDADLSEAHASAAALRVFFYRDYGTAEREYLRALQLDPANADGHRQYATFLAAMERFAEASEELQIARELNSLSLSTNLESARIH